MVIYIENFHHFIIVNLTTMWLVMLQVYPEDLFSNSLGLTNMCIVAVDIGYD